MSRHLPTEKRLPDPSGLSEKPSPVYITTAGYRRLSHELDQLWHVRRPEVTRAVSEAAAMGDRSENAEYIYGKKLLREIDRRVRFLRKRLEILKVVDRLPGDTSRIFFGAYVELENDDGQMLSLRIVGPDEIDPNQHWISINSPMARALLKKQLDDEVQVETPQGTALWWVVGLMYSDA